jgi:hypothetical protein
LQVRPHLGRAALSPGFINYLAAVHLAVHLSSFEQLSSLNGSRLLLSNGSRAAPAAKRRTS